ncbi:hypothetical protein C3747_15g487 [Trypanosoma cruzi]|uniref:Uncharacterized protein n=1 Tax=Trypanosoma cruzi TaxID=5693 RepID=A0A2V2XAS5_TRYCR|nr:hypothetical protein C3747_15g487 [Trypanosoma cruzi]RNC55161.1 hypothetical protein TcCL_ESM07384 [Trypanosoma cruzi]
MESTIFTETVSTAACVSAASRGTVEARKHTLTVLDHLVTHIVDVPFCLARRAEERAHGCSLSLFTVACPGTKLVMLNPRRYPTSHSSQTDGSPAWSHCPNILFVPDSSGGSLLLHYGRRLGPTRIDTTLTRGVEAAPARLRTGVLLNYGWLLRPLQLAIPSTCCWCNSDAAQQARNEPRTETPPPPAGPHPATIRRPADCPVYGKHCGCRVGVVTHMANVCGITRSQALWEVNFSW